MMNWPLRRKNRGLSRPEAIEVLRTMDWGVLSLITSDGSPYGVPLNYAWDEEAQALIFHGALAGRKWAWSSVEPEACFTVVAQAEILPGQLTSAYKSAMVFRTLVRVTNPEAALRALRFLAMRWHPADADLEQYLSDAADKTAVALLKIQMISGKCRDRR